MTFWATILAAGSAAICDVSQYNVVWDGLLPEKNATYFNAMPLGNGILGSNLWLSAEEGKIVFLVSAQDAWSEAGEVIKAGRVEFLFTPNPFLEKVSMVMQVPSGSVLVTASSAAGTIEATAYIHSDSNVGVLNITRLSAGLKVTQSLTRIRTQAETFTPPFNCINYTVSPDVDAGDVIYHRNDPNVRYLDSVLEMENLTPVRSKVEDKLANLTIGLGARKPHGHVLSFAYLTKQTRTVSIFLDELREFASQPLPKYQDHLDWWNGFWNRSYICMSSSSDSFLVAQQYNLNRMLQQGMQGRAPFPIKFNGLIHTANRPPNEDKRDWGGLNWWQNARLPYYSMLPAGDFDMLRISMVEAFYKTLPLAQERTKVYFGHEGVYWPEYTSQFGTMHPASYGCGRAGKTDPPIGYDGDEWNHYNWQGSLDLCLFILDLHQHTLDHALLVRYKPILTGVIDFYRLHFPNGTIYPTQSLETWQCPGYPPTEINCVRNDLPTVAGLRAVIQRVLDLGLVSRPIAQLYEAFLKSVPNLPTTTSKVGPALAPCEKCSPGTSNVENTELYAVHPYRIITFGKPDIDLAINAYTVKTFTSDEGWNQNAMDAAMLGLTQEAKNLVVARAKYPPADGYRFQAFMPHLQDYPPSSDHLGVMNAALMYMIVLPMDTVDGGVWLLPSWPCEWDVEFSVNAPHKVTITGSVKNGKLSYKSSSPSAVIKPVNCI